MYNRSYRYGFKKKDFLEFFVTILKRLTSERTVTKAAREHTASILEVLGFSYVLHNENAFINYRNVR